MTSKNSEQEAKSDVASHLSSGDDSRRRFLKNSAAMLLGAAVAPGGLAATAASAQRTLIQRENEKPGARDWQLTRVRVEKTSGRSPAIEGYCSRQSVLAGESIDFMVSTRPAATFKIEIFRTGYYGGRGARLMTVLGPFTGAQQADPAPGDKRIHECRWDAATSLTIP